MFRLLTKMLLIIAMSLPVFSQQGGIITGIVHDSLSTEPIGYATLTLMNSKDSSIVTGALSTENGEFLIDKIPNGIYDLKGSFIGYTKTFIRGIKISPEQKNINIGNIALLPATVETDEVTVTAEKELVTYSVDKQIVNVSQHVNAKGGMAADVLENIPSVQVDAEGNVSLRGSQSFQVLIDGRPTVLSSQDALKQVPAEMLENIEIITNPSAKYDPEGTSGIINLVLKKQKMSGTNGLVSITTGTRDKYNGTGNFNYRTNKFNLFTSLNYNDMKFHPNSDFTKVVDPGDELYFSRTEMQRYMISQGFSVRSGLDYYINDNNTMTFSGAVGSNNFDRYFPGNYSEWYIDNSSPSNRENETFSKSNDDFELGGLWAAGNIYYQRIFSGNQGHKLESNIKYSLWNGEIDRLHQQTRINAQSQEEIETLAMNKMFNDAGRQDINATLDYTLPFSEKSKLEIGASTHFVYKRFDYLYEDFNIEDAVWEVNNNFTNETDFNQNTSALYSTYSNSTFGIDYKFGLRGEYYERNLEQLTLQEKYPYDDIALFPSAHLSYNLNKSMALQFSYSRRVQRPDDRTLNPFPDFTDQNFVSQGNPDLVPQYTNSMELKYQFNQPKFFVSLGSFYRHTDDMLSQIIIPFDSTRMLITTDNLNEGYLYGAEIALNYNPFDWMRLNVNSNIFNLTLVENFEGFSNERNSNVIDVNGNVMFMFSKTSMFQFATNYSGERVSANGKTKPFYTFNATYRQDLLDRKLTLVLSGRNLFDTARWEIENIVQNFETFGYFAQEGPIINLTLSYKINNYRPQRRENGDVNIDFQNGGI